jgi:hypothetical protein
MFPCASFAAKEPAVRTLPELERLVHGEAGGLLVKEYESPVAVVDVFVNTRVARMVAPAGPDALRSTALVIAGCADVTAGTTAITAKTTARPHTRRTVRQKWRRRDPSAGPSVKDPSPINVMWLGDWRPGRPRYEAPQGTERVQNIPVISACQGVQPRSQ